MTFLQAVFFGSKEPSRGSGFCARPGGDQLTKERTATVGPEGGGERGKSLYRKGELASSLFGSLIWE